MAKVSVVVPTFNRAQYLKETIESVLGQTFQDLEIIVVDDGSKDNTLEILAEYSRRLPERFRYFQQEKSGVCHARNKGIMEARGEFIAFLDDDDQWLVNKLEVYLRYFERDPELALIESRMAVMDKDGKVIPGRLKPQDPPGHDFQSSLEMGTCATSSFMIRRSICGTVRFDEDLLKLTDFDYFLKIAKDYKVLNIDEITAVYRFHESNSCADKAVSYEHQLSFWKNARKKYAAYVAEGFCKKKIAKCAYWLAKECFLKKEFAESFCHSLTAVTEKPLIGKEFWKEGDAWHTKTVKILRPYGLVLTSPIFLLLENLKRR